HGAVVRRAFLGLLDPAVVAGLGHGGEFGVVGAGTAVENRQQARTLGVEFGQLGLAVDRPVVGILGEDDLTHARGFGLVAEEARIDPVVVAGLLVGQLDVTVVQRVGERVAAGAHLRDAVDGTDGRAGRQRERATDTDNQSLDRKIHTF